MSNDWREETYRYTDRSARGAHSADAPRHGGRDAYRAQNAADDPYRSPRADAASRTSAAGYGAYRAPSYSDASAGYDPRRTASRTAHDPYRQPYQSAPNEAYRPTYRPTYSAQPSDRGAYFDDYRGADAYRDPYAPSYREPSFRDAVRPSAYDRYDYGYRPTNGNLYTPPAPNMSDAPRYRAPMSEEAAPTYRPAARYAPPTAREASPRETAGYGGYRTQTSAPRHASPAPAYSAQPADQSERRTQGFGAYRAQSSEPLPAQEAKSVREPEGFGGYRAEPAPESRPAPRASELPLEEKKGAAPETQDEPIVRPRRAIAPPAQNSRTLNASRPAHSADAMQNTSRTPRVPSQDAMQNTSRTPRVSSQDAMQNTSRTPRVPAQEPQKKEPAMDSEKRLERMRRAGEAALRAQGYQEEDANAFMNTGMINLDAVLGGLNEDGVDPVLSAQQTARMAVIRQAQLDAPLEQPPQVKGTHSRPGYDASVPPEKKKKRVLRGIVEWVAMLAAAVAVAFLLRTYIFSFYRVQGPSMQPTLYTGELLFVNKIGYRVGDIERFDVVVCHYPGGDEYYVKRVIALPGDTVRIDKGTVYVNDEALSEEYVVNHDTSSMAEVTVAEDSYMVFGDNRVDSMDSRSIGAIGRDAIVGRAVAVTWPLGKISTISRIDDTAAEPGQTPATSEKPAPSETEKADKIEQTDEADNTEESTVAASEEPEATNLSEVPADN